MNAGQARRAIAERAAAGAARNPGLTAAHLVGGITALPDEEPVPPYRDVDVILIFAEGSPALARCGPCSHALGLQHDGLMVDARPRPLADYRCAAAVLANPEIAHHLTLAGSIVLDPAGLLRELQPEVAREHHRRRWVRARVEHERAGLERARRQLGGAQTSVGAAGEALILGSSFTHVMALIGMAALRPPATGSRGALRLREVLAERGRLDLYEEMLRVAGVSGSDPTHVEWLVAEGTALFDRAVRIERTPQPFGPRLHAHLRPSLVEACWSLIDEGHHQEALLWLTPFYITACAVLLADGPEEERPATASFLDTFLGGIGLRTQEERRARIAAAGRLYDDVVALAEEIIGAHPGLVD